MLRLQRHTPPGGRYRRYRAGPGRKPRCLAETLTSIQRRSTSAHLVWLRRGHFPSHFPSLQSRSLGYASEVSGGFLVKAVRPADNDWLKIRGELTRKAEL